MPQRRWQPPPMEPQSDAKRSAAKHPLDVGVVRNILKVNPDLRKGRTTFQVKKALEQGEALAATSHPRPSAAPPQVASARSAPAADPRAASGAAELADTVDFFVRGKVDRFEARAKELAAQRRALDAEEQRAKADLCDQIVRFIAMLDDAAVAMHGRAALARHAELLTKLGVNVAAVLERAQKARR